MPRPQHSQVTGGWACQGSCAWDESTLEGLSPGQRWVRGLQPSHLSCKGLCCSPSCSSAHNPDVHMVLQNMPCYEIKSSRSKASACAGQGMVRLPEASMSPGVGLLWPLPEPAGMHSAWLQSRQLHLTSHARHPDRIVWAAAQHKLLPRCGCRGCVGCALCPCKSVMTGAVLGLNWT